MGRAWAVVDLGFGDAGKGLVVDALVRRTGADVVVRAQGGAQAAHTVHTPDGRRHTFAQLGAGSFVAGTCTVLAPGMIVHPTALRVEAERFVAAGGPPPEVWLHPGCALITPYDQALNRLRELARGAGRHGSCGVGVGEVAASVLGGEEVPRAGDLCDVDRLRERLCTRRARARAVLAELTLPDDPRVHAERAVFDTAGVDDAWLARVGPLASIVVTDDEVGARLRAARGVIFEGAQGVLLDRTRGFPPHQGWTDAGFGPAAALVDRHCPHTTLHRLGVLRAFPTRHGAGPFPSEVLGRTFPEDNSPNPWQGPVRSGDFDAVLGRYALAAVGGVDTLVLTWLDALAHTPFRLVDAYLLDGVPTASLPAPGDAAHQAGIGRLLGRAQARRGPAVVGEPEVLAAVEAALGVPVGLVSRGRTASTFEDRGIGEPEGGAPRPA